jgi:hypothetical protein
VYHVVAHNAGRRKGVRTSTVFRAPLRLCGAEVETHTDKTLRIVVMPQMCTLNLSS